MMNIYIYIYIDYIYIYIYAKHDLYVIAPPVIVSPGGGIPPGNEDSHTNIINHDKYVIPMEIINSMKTPDFPLKRH
jgi:hypothetical protein